MRDYLTYRSSAIRYWERRRIVYNVALVPPAFFSYMLCAGVFSVGDKTEVYYGFVLLMFGLYALGANLCYSFAYVLEFFFGSDHADARWVRVGRPAVFGAGLALAIVLALIGGRDVALLEFHHESKKKMSTRRVSQRRLSIGLAFAPRWPGVAAYVGPLDTLHEGRSSPTPPQHYPRFDEFCAVVRAERIPGRVSYKFGPREDGDADAYS